MEMILKERTRLMFRERIRLFEDKYNQIKKIEHSYLSDELECYGVYLDITTTKWYDIIHYTGTLDAEHLKVIFTDMGTGRVDRWYASDNI